MSLLLALLFVTSAHAQVGLNVDIRSMVEQEFGTDAPVMLEIARCESKFRQYTDAGNPLYGGYQGRMVGIFQVYSDIHASGARAMGMDIETAEGNIAYARHLYNREGTVPWNSSSSCWRNSVVAASTASNASTPTESGALTMDMSLGTIHPQVRTLQQLLNSGGFRITEDGPGSPGNETTTYGALTRAAVQKFQCAQNIICSGDGWSTGYGVFGPRTRAALLAQAGTKATPAESAQSPVNELIRTPQTEPQNTPASEPQTTPPAADDAAIAALQAQIAELQKQLETLLAARAQ